MDDIHEALVHFFSGEADDLQIKKAIKFKKKNPEEYALLSKLWDRRKEISIVDRDSHLAWERLLSRIETNKSIKNPVIPIFRYWRQLAAAVVLIASTIGWYNFIGNAGKWDSIEVASKERVILPDGSTVYLNEGASISFPEGFNDKQREVKLRGEAFFNVVKDESRPFTISTSSTKVKVLGTSFNVNATNSFTEVSVKEGIVEVKQTTGNERVILTEGLAAISNEYGLNKKSADANFDSWKTGLFFFEETELQDAVKSLNTFYDDKIVLKSTTSGCNLTAKFNVDELTVIVEILTHACGLEVKEMGGKFIIEEK
ncbi:FecR domain-containing protein [Ekhidna sp.]|uniref:FecR family protein n=1 Tax=Ekhidna sp. TaxID=2608089 RepID=UPI0032997881